jgi:hypothetical protein
VEKSRSHEPAENDGDGRRGEKQGEENPEKESHLEDKRKKRCNCSMNREDLFTAGPEFSAGKDVVLWTVASGENSFQPTVRGRGTK